MTTTYLEQTTSVDAIKELTQVHRTIDTPEVVGLLKDLKKSAEPYAKKMLDTAISSAIENSDSSHVAEAFREFAETVEKERAKALEKALARLVQRLDL
jgi:Mg/Co/Ni transporter MgtE